MTIAMPLQLSYSTKEQFKTGLDLVSGNGVAPSIVVDPDDADARVGRFGVEGTSAGTSATEITLENAESEVWMTFRYRWDHDHGNDPAMIVLQMFDDSDTLIIWELRQTPVGTALVSTEPSPVPLSFTTPVTKSEWAYIRLRWLAGSGSAGRFEAWTSADDGETWTLQRSASHSSDLPVRKLRIGSTTIGTLATASGDKEVWISDLKIGTTSESVQWIDHGPMFTAASTVDGRDSSKVSIGWMYYYDLNRKALAGADDGDLIVTPQISVSGEDDWTSGDPVDLSDLIDNDTIGEAVAHGVFHDVDSGTYDVRLIVSNDSGTLYTTEASTLKTLPASGGSQDEQYTVAWISCQQQRIQWGMTPGLEHLIEEHGSDLSMIICVDDFFYGDPIAPGDNNWDQILTVEESREVWRYQLLWNPRINRAARSAAFVIVKGDHEWHYDNSFGTNTWKPSDTPSAPLDFEALNAVARDSFAVWIDPGLYNDSDTSAARGQSFATPSSRFIVMDMREARDIRDGHETVLGASQLAAVIDIIANETRPVIHLFCAGPYDTAYQLQSTPPVNDGFGGHSMGILPDQSDHPDADTTGRTQTAYLAERDAIFQAIADNPNITAAYLHGGDTHFAYVASQWANDFGEKIRPAWHCMPSQFMLRPPSTLDDEVADVDYVVTEAELGVTANNPAEPTYGYGLLEFNGDTREVEQTLFGGASLASIDELYSDTDEYDESPDPPIPPATTTISGIEFQSWCEIEVDESTTLNTWTTGDDGDEMFLIFRKSSGTQDSFILGPGEIETLGQLADAINALEGVTCRIREPYSAATSIDIMTLSIGSNDIVYTVPFGSSIEGPATFEMAGEEIGEPPEPGEAPTLDQNIANQTFVTEQAVSVDLSTNFSSPTAMTFALTSGTLPDGLTLTSAGILEGTAPDTTQTASGLRITATNDDGSTQSNSFSITIIPPLDEGMAGEGGTQHLTLSGGVRTKAVPRSRPTRRMR